MIPSLPECGFATGYILGPQNGRWYVGLGKHPGRSGDFWNVELTNSGTERAGDDDDDVDKGDERAISGSRGA